MPCSECISRCYDKIHKRILNKKWPKEKCIFTHVAVTGDKLSFFGITMFGRASGFNHAGLTRVEFYIALPYVSGVNCLV